MLKRWVDTFMSLICSRRGSHSKCRLWWIGCKWCKRKILLQMHQVGFCQGSDYKSLDRQESRRIAETLTGFLQFLAHK
jgi:hypothetical protein